MDPKLRKQLFIRKHLAGIITILAITLILPLTLILSQTTTQYQQQAAGTEKKTPDSSQNSPSALTTQENYTLLMKCFDKPNQTNPCTPTQLKSVDLNGDGIVNGIDYNLYVRQTAGQKKPQ